MSLTNDYQSLIHQRISVVNFQTIFSNEDECLELYFNLRFAGCNCIKCGRSVVSNYARISRKNSDGVPKKAYRCKSCHTYIYPLANTIFRGSPIPLTRIFYIIYMMCISKSSMSAIEVENTIGISYKTAHRLMMLLRMVLYSTDKSKMKGTVEVDEAFIGGGSKKYNWSGISTRKEPIIGLVERETKMVRLFLVKNRSSKTINKLIRENIEYGSAVYTDSWKGYNDLCKHYQHEIIDHSKREYVRGIVHTNTIENVWSHFKRNLRKTHIKISNKYVHLYISEAAWRHNSKGKTPMELFNEILVRSFFIYDTTVT